MKEFKVDVTPMLKRLEVVSKKGISGFLSGEFRSIFKGRGLEFHGYRNYNPAEDDAKQIDWKASLRSRYLVVKELIEERNNNVMFLFDVSSSMSFGSINKLKNEYAIELFASLAYSLLTEGDSVGLTMFSNKVVDMITPNIGNKQYYIMLETVTDPSKYEGECNLENTLHEFNAMMARPAIIIIVSDFIGLKGDWYEKLKVLATKHEVIALVVKDPRDMIIPAEVGQVFVESPFTGESLLIDTKLVKEQYEKLAHDQNQQLKKMFKDLRIDCLFLTTDKPFTKTIFSFFKQRSMGGLGG
jgi:uncharacterized protein (DUF58 family)